MLVWLMEKTSVVGRVVVTIFIGFVIIGIFLAILITSDQTQKRVEAQFRSLQEDHREIRALMMRNAARFGGIIEQNTEAVKKTKKAVDDLPDN